MIVLIDMGYLMFYRLHATNRWLTFQKEYKDIEITEDIICEYFEKHLISQLDKLKKNKKYKKFCFCRDTPQCHVWRRSDYEEYKGTRGQATLLIRKVQEIFYRIVSNYGTVLECDKLEADDVAYLTVKYIREKCGIQKEILIITSDRDYLQMIDENVSIIDGSGKNVIGSGDPAKDKMIKILMGDSSDNIPPVCKGCGKKTAATLAENELLRNEYLKKNNCIAEFERNQRLICMDQIPEALVDEFYELNMAHLNKLLNDE